MDLTSAVTNLGNDYVSKVTQAMKNSVATDDANISATDSFDSIYNSVAGLLNNTNTYVQQAQQAEIDYAMGKLTSTHELSIIEEKANLALQYTVAVKNGILDAYKEIMQIQIKKKKR